MFRQNKADDTTTGHLIVLLQYDWPKHESVFLQILDKIRSQKAFVYNVFFNYIISILDSRSNKVYLLSSVVTRAINSNASYP